VTRYAVTKKDDKYVVKESLKDLIKLSVQTLPADISKAFEQANQVPGLREALAVLDVPSSALRGMVEETTKPIDTSTVGRAITSIGGLPIRPATGLIKGTVRRFKDPDYYAGEALSEGLTEKGFDPRLAMLMGLGLEVAIPGPGEFVKGGKVAGKMSKVSPSDFSKAVDATKTAKAGKIIEIPLNRIKVNDDFNMAIEDVLQGVKSRSKLDPLASILPDGMYKIEDGNHKVADAMLNGDKTIKVYTNEPFYRKLAEAEEKVRPTPIRNADNTRLAGSVSNKPLEPLAKDKGTILYHSSEDTFKSGKPEFDAYFGNKNWKKNFSKEFGEKEYEVVLPKESKVLDLNKNTPETEAFIKKWGGTRDDFYDEDWVEKAKILPELRKLGYEGAKFGDEYILTKELIGKLKTL